ncbi:MAG: putative DNA modification/repair radical SAM protein [Desulfocapsaceae bacterium]|nr:putative DNA modification/repair radical SAM protein [Desulfocapsaceae bacterium]
MKIEEKLRILADAAKYDVSCASSGSDRGTTAGGIGNGHKSGICHSWSADGRCISLLKVLLSNACVYDCCYCINRRSNNRERATFTPVEVAELTINFYLRNYIEGLFLSSAVYSSADATMADMIEVCRLLREKHQFNGYIHLKVIPGASRELVNKAGILADRLSVNIELPSESSLLRLAPQKTKISIFTPMQQIGESFQGHRLERKRGKKSLRFCPAGQSTQLIVGASQENDLQILNLSAGLYKKMHLKRVYYSAYMAVNTDPSLPVPVGGPPLMREHRLYQADWLLRFYRFQAHEILTDAAPNLDERIDPKAAWALRNYELFPLDINRASYEELLRVPGIGVISARRIVQTRRVTTIRLEDLTKIGLVLKRAKYFISLNGRKVVQAPYSFKQVVEAMHTIEKPKNQRPRQSPQLRLF